MPFHSMGGILGPVIGGVLLSLAFSNQMIFFVFAIPGLVAAFAISMVRDNRSYQKELERLNRETLAV